MIDIFEEYATDSKLEVEGARVPYKGGFLILARANNRKYSKALNAAVEKHQAELDLKDDNSDAVSDKILIDVIATTILLGWEGIGYKKKALDYNLDNAKMLLAHKDFRVEVAKLSESREAYRIKQVEEVTKNS